jgi:hypothetical protein
VLALYRRTGRWGHRRDDAISTHHRRMISRSTSACKASVSSRESHGMEPMQRIGPATGAEIERLAQAGSR